MVTAILYRGQHRRPECTPRDCRSSSRARRRFTVCGVRYGGYRRDWRPRNPGSDRRGHSVSALARAPEKATALGSAAHPRPAAVAAPPVTAAAGSPPAALERLTAVTHPRAAVLHDYAAADDPPPGWRRPAPAARTGQDAHVTLLGRLGQTPGRCCARGPHTNGRQPGWSRATARDPGPGKHLNALSAEAGPRLHREAHGRPGVPGGLRRYDPERGDSESGAAHHRPDAGALGEKHCLRGRLGVVAC